MTTVVTDSTELIDTSTLEYPLSLPILKQRNPEKTWSRTMLLTNLQALGYDMVHPTTPPEGDVVEVGSPELNDENQWEQTWVVREFTPTEYAEFLERKKEEHVEKIKTLQRAAEQRGVLYSFPQGDYHVQCRDADPGRLAGLHSKAQELIALGVEAPVMDFRVYENAVLSLTPEQMRKMTSDVAISYTRLLKVFWDLIDLTRIADSVEDFPEIPEEVPSVFPDPVQ